MNEPPAKIEPTATGKELYPPDGIYDELWTCTCTPECVQPCKGQCGCEACGAAYSDFLSSE